MIKKLNCNYKGISFLYLCMIILFLLITHISARCIWPSPSKLYPENLVRLTIDEDLDKYGTRKYSIDIDTSLQIPSIIYTIKSIEPNNIAYNPSPSEFIINVSHAESLKWDDKIIVTVTAVSPCLLTRHLGYSTYEIDIVSDLMLYQRYNDTLTPNFNNTLTEDGWTSQSHLTYIPYSTETFVVGREYINGPCRGAWIDSTLNILNTSQYTYWNLTTRERDDNNPFIGGTHNLPRCHRPSLGNVCIVNARTRLTWLPGCVHNVSIWQAVSQIARLTPTMKQTQYLPSDFNTSRRYPAIDNRDMRYDICKSKLCTSEGSCITRQFKNEKLSNDGNIFIHQHHILNTSWIEISCEFEVVGFLDNIWSPHIYMRKWYGYEWY